MLSSRIMNIVALFALIVYIALPHVAADSCCDACRRQGIYCPDDSTISTKCYCDTVGYCKRCDSSLSGLSIFLIIFFSALIVVSIFLCCRYISGCPCYYRRNERFPQMGVVYNYSGAPGQPVQALPYGQPIHVASPMNAPNADAPYAQPAQPMYAASPVMMNPGSPVVMNPGFPVMQSGPYHYVASNASAPPQYPEGQAPVQGEQYSQPAPIVHHI